MHNVTQRAILFTTCNVLLHCLKQKLDLSDTTHQANDHQQEYLQRKLTTYITFLNTIQNDPSWEPLSHTKANFFGKWNRHSAEWKKIKGHTPTEERLVTNPIVPLDFYERTTASTASLFPYLSPFHQHLTAAEAQSQLWQEQMPRRTTTAKIC